MTVSTYCKNNFLNGEGFDAVSLHSAFPGATGANELSGAPYVRLAAVVNGAVGGSRALNAGLSFGVPISTVSWLGFWYLSNFLFALPNGGATPKNFMWTADETFIRAALHGWSDGQKVVLYQGTPPAPLVEGTTYFVRDSTTNKFNLAATLGGVAIVLTAPPSFGCVIAAISETVYLGANTHSLTAFTAVLPD